jgi:hypothetical protein
VRAKHDLPRLEFGFERAQRPVYQSAGLECEAQLGEAGVEQALVRQAGPGRTTWGGFFFLAAGRGDGARSFQ